MKPLFKNLIYFAIIGAAVFFFFRTKSKNQLHENGAAEFMTNIKAGVKNQAGFANFYSFDGYNMEELKAKEVIDVTSNKTMLLKDVLMKENLFINFWFKGCHGCEAEMPDVEQFYTKDKQQIQFAILSNDSPEAVRKYVAQNNFTLPFYVFKDGDFPSGINIFPTSHLIVKNKTAFEYAGMGYYVSPIFGNYVDSLLAK